MRFILLSAALAACAVACSSPAPDSVVEKAPPSETTTPPGGTSTPPANPTTTTDPPPPPPPVDPATAADCDAFGSAYCGKVFGCNIPTKNLFVDQASCTSRFSGWCKARITAPATGLTHAAITKCASSINAGTCDGLQDSDGPPQGCTFKGQLTVNAKCALDEQCASGQCSASSTSCGQCLLKNAIGGACTGNEQCDYGLYCTSAKKCAAKPKLGEACTSATGCSATTACIGGSCVAKAKLGEACDPSFGSDPANTSPPCKDGLSMQCSSVTKKCESAVFAKLGEPCGVMANNYVFCSGGTVCTSINGESTCQAEVAVGGACTKSTQCGIATECYGGVCAFENASICK